MKGPKTLYVSDLDGTLLRHDQTVSPFTAETINTLTARGMLFSYATARSLVTAKTVTKGSTRTFRLSSITGRLCAITSRRKFCSQITLTLPCTRF